MSTRQNNLVRLEHFALTGALLELNPAIESCTGIGALAGVSPRQVTIFTLSYSTDSKRLLTDGRLPKGCRRLYAGWPIDLALRLLLPPLVEFRCGQQLGAKIRAVVTETLWYRLRKTAPAP